MHKLVISDLVQRAVACGLNFERPRIADGATPAEIGAVRELVARIGGWAAAGETTVIHCMGEWRRAGPPFCLSGGGLGSKSVGFRLTPA